MTEEAEAPPLLLFSAASAGYDNVRVFRNLNLSLASGQGVCLVGPNGCGKSTVLRCVLGLAKLIEGSITLDGHSVSAIPRCDLANKGVGYVPQGRGDLPSLTVEENIRLAAKSARLNATTAAVQTVLNCLPPLEGVRSKQVSHLSGAQRTLVAFGRALTLRPKLRVLVLDEVSAGLSPSNAALVRSLLLQLQAEGTAILMAEQNLGFVRTLGVPIVEPKWEFRREMLDLKSAEVC